MEYRKLLVAYGSQTGSAQDVAERVGRQSKQIHFASRVTSLDDYPLSQFIQVPLAVFICSTTGQGEEPDNMKTFWRFLLRKNLPNDCLCGLRFAVLGLGDSSYSKYNFAAKKLHKRLGQLGARPIVSLTLADDQHDLGTDAVVNPWMETLWNTLLKLYPLPRGLTRGTSTYISPKYSVCEIDSDRSVPKISNDVSVSEINNDGPSRTTTGLGDGRHPRVEDGSETPAAPFGQTHPFLATVISNQRLTREGHFQDVRLIKLDLEDSTLSYDTGDVLMVQPRNLPEVVEDFCRIVGLEPESLLVVAQREPDISVPQLVSSGSCLREWVERYFDAQAVPRRYFFEVLRQFAAGELEKEKLAEFLSPEGQRELYNYCNAPRRTSLEVLQDFRRVLDVLPLDYLFELFTPIKPRAFSIASPGPGSSDVDLLVAVVSYKTKLVRPRRGLCSTWLSTLQPGDRVPVWIKRRSLVFPKDSSVPVIMVGPGTGCAPFRAFLLERSRRNVGGNYMFFGCRNREGDFFFAEEWQRMVDRGLLTLFAAFSRDQDRKIYVQHLMLENSSLVWDLISNRGAWFFLAGNSKQMPRDVTDALKDIFVKEGHMSTHDAEAYLKTLESKHRFQDETWS